MMQVKIRNLFQKTFVVRHKKLLLAVAVITALVFLFVISDLCFPLDTHIDYSTVITDCDSNIIYAGLSPLRPVRCWPPRWRK